ncbi:PQQ-binding-like beta-propeller repeat protein [Streptomyces sp. NPDC085481]|uniref:outer membrane protein assembly factor BamB family protein n=1 Tax=Streptomyces sp. NPDC085481 TaxID=3365727 RepID=UPI0037D405E6
MNHSQGRTAGLAPRRRPPARSVALLASLFALVLTLVSPVAPAARAAVAADCGGAGVERFGPASLTGAIVGATVHEGRAYVVTRGFKPPVLAEYDLATRRVVRETPIPDGPEAGSPEGAWATTVSGGKIYIGTYPVPDLYRFDPATGTITRVASFGVEGGFVWSLATAPDGKVYAGTYPDGKVWEYNPATGAKRSWVPDAAERYVRGVDVDDTYIYAALPEAKKLVSINRSTGAVKTLATSTAGFSTVSVGRTRVRAGAGNTLYDVKTDGTDLRTVNVGASIDSFGLAPDYTAYISTRPKGEIFRYRTAEPLESLGIPRSQEETRGLFLDGNTLTGFSGSGGVWTMDVTTGQSEYTNLLNAGLTGGAERPQSILFDQDRGNVWVGGHFSFTVHTPATGAKTTVWVPGEPKALTRRGDKLYAAIYPSSEIVELDLSDPQAPLRSLGYLGNGQARPWDIEYDPATDRLLVASAPLGTSTQGALSVIDPVTGQKDVYLNVIPNESLMSLSLGPDGIVYLGGDVRGGGGGDPADWNSAASVSAFDLATRTVKWSLDPVAGNQTIQDIKVHNGILYGVFKRNAGWFTMNVTTRQVLDKGTLPGYGEIEVAQDKVFASTYFGGGNVHQLGPGLADPKLIATGLGDDWYTNPQLAFEPGSFNAWALVGRDLARLRLDPACPTLTVTP